MTTMQLPMYFTLSDAAALLHVSKRWLLDLLYRHREIGFKAGRRWLFSHADVSRIENLLRRSTERSCSSSSRQNQDEHNTGIVAARTSASLWSEARRLLRNESLGLSSHDGGGKSRPGPTKSKDSE